MCYKKNVLTITRMSIRTDTCQFRGRDSQIYSVEGEASKRIYAVREETDKDSSDYQTRSCMARCMENARRKLERPAMPCTRAPIGISKETAKPEIASEKNSKTVYGCIVESHESTW